MEYLHIQQSLPQFSKMKKEPQLLKEQNPFPSSLLGKENNTKIPFLFFKKIQLNLHTRTLKIKVSLR